MFDVRSGSIKTGKFADLIAVAGGPLKEIMELERVRFVMKGGVVFKDELTAKRATTTATTTASPSK